MATTLGMENMRNDLGKRENFIQIQSVNRD